jgi:hypothetical protein
MSASLSPGIDSLVLSVARPLDSDGVTPRDDLIGLKVWYSTTSGFDPSQGQGTLVYDGAGLIATISGLTARATYYVKYALISEIEPDYYTISDQLSAIPAYGSTTVDNTPPPTPTGVTVSSAITSVFIQHDSPVYSQGRGHKKTHVYAMKTTASTPAASIVFANATKVAEFTGTIFTMSSNPGTTWHIWLKWETNDGYFSAVASGGTSGNETTTGQDVTSLLGVLNKQLTASELATSLSTRIDLIDTASTGLVDKVTGLITTYGDTANSATNAAAALAAKTAAIAAQTGAETAATTATTKATNAATSATAAATSATNAATSETNAGTSAGAAATSATTASTKAAEAGTSATSAATSATNAASSESAAATSATTAATSATTAGEKATAASNSATSAATSATNAGTSATSAATSATTATTKAAAASVSATNAATSETNAAGSATSAASSLTSVQAVATDYNGAVQTLARTVAGSDGATAQYTVKVQTGTNNAKYVAGFGLSSTTTAAGDSTSNFAIVADKFSIAPVASGINANSASPFFVLTQTTKIDGIDVPAGTYLKTAFIADATITTAKIADAAITSAKIDSLSASKITAGTIKVDLAIKSPDEKFIVDFQNKYISITV